MEHKLNELLKAIRELNVQQIQPKIAFCKDQNDFYLYIDINGMDTSSIDIDYAGRTLSVKAKLGKWIGSVITNGMARRDLLLNVNLVDGLEFSPAEVLNGHLVLQFCIPEPTGSKIKIGTQNTSTKSTAKPKGPFNKPKEDTIISE